MSLDMLDAERKASCVRCGMSGRLQQGEGKRLHSPGCMIGQRRGVRLKEGSRIESAMQKVVSVLLSM